MIYNRATAFGLQFAPDWMIKMTERKRFESLRVRSHSAAISPITILNFLAVCNFGRIDHGDAALKPGGARLDGEILEAREVRYAAAETDDGALVLTVAEDSDPPQSEDDYLQLLKLYLGAKLLGAEVSFGGLWCERLPPEQFFKSHLAQEQIITAADQILHHETCLTLRDLEEVHKHLVGEKRGASELMQDKNFREIFPAIQERWGDFGFIRHRSGVEIRTQWQDREFLSTHAYEVPSPAEPLLEKWYKHKGLDLEEDYFRKHRTRLWHLARLLNKVPAKDKQRVYEWVDAIRFDIEQYHESRGATQMPELSECDFGTGILTVDRNYNFELID